MKHFTKSGATNVKRFFPVFLAAITLNTLLIAQSMKLPSAGRFILPVSLGKELLAQCSRPNPGANSQFWQPSSADIDVLETALDKYVAEREKAGKEIPPKNLAYHRQYVGFIRHSDSGHEPVRLIYGNFYPEGILSELRGNHNESTEVVDICDGGSALWGVVYRVSNKTFENLAFNGPG